MIGVSSGASAPEDVVQAVLAWLRSAGVAEVEEVEAPDERVVFTLPMFKPSAGAETPAT